MSEKPTHICDDFKLNPLIMPEEEAKKFCRYTFDSLDKATQDVNTGTTNIQNVNRIAEETKREIDISIQKINATSIYLIIFSIISFLILLIVLILLIYLIYKKIEI
jgi:hypothetical protein